MLTEIILQYDLLDADYNKNKVLQQRPPGFSTERTALKLQYCL